MGFGVTLSAQVGTTLIAVYGISIGSTRSVSLRGLFTVGLAAFLVNVTLVSVLLGLIWLPLAIPFALWQSLRALDLSGTDLNFSVNRGRC